MRANLIVLGLILFVIRSQAQFQSETTTVLSIDTIEYDETLKYQTKYLLGNKEIVISSLFDKKKAFNLSGYKGMIVRYKNQKVTKYITLEEVYCEGKSLIFFPSFKGDSIDNLEGYQHKVIRSGDVEIYVLYGYFLGCNGSYCNNAALLMIEFRREKIRKVGYVGFDRSRVDFHSVLGEIQDEVFVLKLKDSEGSEMILSFCKHVQFEGHIDTKPFFCIK